MRVKVKVIAVGHGGVEQEIDLLLDVVHMGERDGRIYGEVGTEIGDEVGRFNFKPNPGFNAWGSPEATTEPSSEVKK